MANVARACGVMTHLLLVDDSVSNLALLEACLAPLECDITLATRGKEALELLSRDPIDLVLLDILLPDLDGVEVLRRMRSRRDSPYIPVVLVTALGEHEDRVRGLEAGADEFLEKPVDRAILLARVRALLRAKATQEQLAARAVALERAEHERQCLCRDITELKEGRSLLERAVRARDEFLTLASHELKTPLTSLRLDVSALQRIAREQPSDADRTGKHAEALDRGLRRLESILDRLLDAGRTSAVGVELRVQATDLGAIVRDSTGRFARALEQAECSLLLRIDDSPLVGQWDPFRLTSIVDNLLSNAIKYGPGKPIEIVTTRAPRGVLLSVRDYGIGVPLKDHARIFGQFERAVSQENYGGFGLGLWITRLIVDAMGGQIRLESRPGAGALFTVELPTMPPETMTATQCLGEAI